MAALRRLLAQRDLAVLLCVAVLWLKLLVPTGYMIDAGDGRFAVMPCSGTMPAAASPVMAHGAMAHSAPADHPRHERSMSDLPCAFAGLSAPMLGGIDPVQVAAPVAFVPALGLVVALLPAPASPVRWRPPLRGPPA